MIKEIQEILHNIKQLRPVKDTVTIYGNYTEKQKEAIYNDAKREYETRAALKNCEDVSNVNSFADFIGEELRRRNNQSGNYATAVINSNGGYFTADDDFQRGNCKFTRKLSQQWNTFKDCIDRTYGHEELLRLLQKLSPSILNFHEIYRELLDVRIIGRGEMQSNPFYINGEAASGYKIKYKMQGGEVEESILPENFTVKLPYAKGNYDKVYEVDVQLMYLNDGHGGLKILVQAPIFEEIEEKALLDEVDILKAELSEYKDLLVLFNF